MLTAVARTSLRRVAVTLPYRPLTDPVVARPSLSAPRAQPFSSTPRVAEAAAAKKKAPAKKKPAAKEKKKPAPRKKKELTPEEKERELIRDLKKQALLKEPSRLPDTAWLMFIQQETKGTQMQNDFTNTVRAVSEKFKALSSGELERLQSRADANRANNAEKYKLWVESHTPAEIYNANLARARLARMNVQSKARKIPDERMPKRPMNAYLTYVKEQWMTGDFSGAVENTGPELARGWKALPEEEKKRYEDHAATKLAEYSRRRNEILGK